MQEADDFGVTIEQYSEAAMRFSEALTERLDRRTAKATANWLFVYGNVKEPRHLLQFAEMTAGALLATMVVDGFVTLTPEGTATDEEVAERRERREQNRAEGQDLLSVLTEAIDGQNIERPRPGGYL